MKQGMSEEAFLAQVVRAARLLGYLVYHTRDSRRSARGFPDLVLVRAMDGRLIFAELKSSRGRVTAEQQAWLHALRAAGQRAYLWRPADWADLVTVLQGGLR